MSKCYKLSNICQQVPLHAGPAAWTRDPGGDNKLPSLSLASAASGGRSRGQVGSCCSQLFLLPSGPGGPSGSQRGEREIGAWSLLNISLFETA